MGLLGNLALQNDIPVACQTHSGGAARCSQTMLGFSGAEGLWHPNELVFTGNDEVLSGHLCFNHGADVKRGKVISPDLSACVA